MYLENPTELQTALTKKHCEEKWSKKSRENATVLHENNFDLTRKIVKKIVKTVFLAVRNFDLTRIERKNSKAHFQKMYFNLTRKIVKKIVKTVFFSSKKL